MKKVMTAYQAMKWLFMEELPKEPPAGGGFSANPLSGLAELGTRVDSGGLNRFGVYSCAIGDAMPCREAVDLLDIIDAMSLVDIRVGSGVVAVLPPVTIKLDTHSLGDLAAGIIDQALARVARAHQGDRRWRAVLQSVAALGVGDAWVCDWEVVADVERHPTNGQPLWFARDTVMMPAGVDGTGAERVVAHTIEVSGRTVAGRVRADAYRKPCLVPDPTPLVEDRLGYELLRLGLEALSARAGDLGGVALVGSGLRPHPWCGQVPPVLHARFDFAN